MRSPNRVQPRRSCGHWLVLAAWAVAPVAHALSLGEPRLLSEPGQALVAEVPLRDWGPPALANIQVRWAADPAWLAAGLTPIARDQFQIRLEDRPDGPVLRVQSLSPLTTETLDLLIELQWPKRRLLRELGLLLGSPSDPKVGPRLQVPSVLWVQPGDTASALALSHLDPDASLAQALMALAQANPDAFVQGNVNRLRAGVALKVPAAEQIHAIDPQEAQQQVARQVEAFAQYRAQLAARSGSAPDDSNQVATGKVQTPQRDPVPAQGDRLTLSTPGSDDADRIAAQKQAQQTADRAAEINRNIQDLNRLVQSGDAAGLPIPAPETLSSRASERIEQLAQSPYTPWAAWGLVLTLLAWIAARVLRRDRPAQSPQGSAPAPSVGLQVDFDLNLPPADTLPPLSEQVHVPPTPVQRDSSRASASPQQNSTLDPMAGLSLDLSPTDPHEERLALAQSLWLRGLSHTALVLAREVATQAPAPWSERARQWLNERT